MDPTAKYSEDTEPLISLVSLTKVYISLSLQAETLGFDAKICAVVI